MERVTRGAGLLGLVLLVDALIAAHAWPVPLLGPLDWTGHLATTALALLAAERLGLRAAPRLLLVVLASSVLIDLDHVPLYLGVPGVEGAGGRPLTHSLVAVTAVLAVAAVRHSRTLLAVAAGLALHLVRDSSTGPGIPLLWPADVVVHLPYAPYAVLLGVLALVAALPDRAGQGAVGSSPPRRR